MRQFHDMMPHMLDLESGPVFIIDFNRRICYACKAMPYALIDDRWNSCVLLHEEDWKWVT